MDDNTNIVKENYGLVPRVIEHIFQRVEREAREKEMMEEEEEEEEELPASSLLETSSDYLVRVSFVEILKEQVRDLLSRDPSSSSSSNEDSNQEMREEENERESAPSSSSSSSSSSSLLPKPTSEREKRRRRATQRREMLRRQRERRRVDQPTTTTTSTTSTTTAPPPIKIHDDGKGNVHLSGVRSVTVRTAQELHAQLYRGTLARTTGATCMNVSSSRSHAIMTITGACSADVVVCVFLSLPI